MAEHNELGRKGEEIAASYLQKKGYKILSKNYRFKHLELDIVCQKEDVLIVVEVKTRQSEYLADPSQMVSPSKQKGIIKAANAYIEEYEVDLECQFDVIVVILNQKIQKVEHIEDAFYPTL